MGIERGVDRKRGLEGQRLAGAVRPSRRHSEARGISRRKSSEHPDGKRRPVICNSRRYRRDFRARNKRAIRTRVHPGLFLGRAIRSVPFFWRRPRRYASKSGLEVCCASSPFSRRNRALALSVGASFDWNARTRGGAKNWLGSARELGPFLEH